MFANAKRILITTESHDVYIVRQRTPDTFQGFCPNCGEGVGMMDFNMAITCSGIGGWKLIDQIEKGVIHTVEVSSGHLLVCERSLARTGG